MSYHTTTTSFPGPGNWGVQVGHNAGSIETHIHTPERPETPPRPSCVVPLPRDRDFVPRGSLLDQIREKCTEPAARVALVGLGGVGKSQLAVEYCYRVEEQSPETWVFWVRATNPSRLDQDFRDIAERTRILGRNDPKADIYKLVHNWLRNSRNGPWLLVIDNADDASVLHPPSDSQSSTTSNGSSDSPSALKQHLLRYLPASRHGSILVTSRTRRAAMEVVEDDNIISIEPMDHTTACALIRKKLRNHIDGDDDIATLAAALDNMPLALVHAASYIREGGARCSVRTFLDDYLQDDHRKAYLLEQKAYHIREGIADHNILKAWQISFKHLQDNKPSAANLLSFMSFFDRQGIPESLLRPEKGTDRDLTSNTKDEDEFERDIRTLRDFSFITFTNDPSMFEMHSLVQLAMRNWLESNHQVEKWRERFTACLDIHFPIVDHKNWKTCTALFPHAKRVVNQRPKNHDYLKLWAGLLLKVAGYSIQLAQHSEAAEMTMQGTEAIKEILGEDNQLVLRGSISLASYMMLAGRLKEAEVAVLNVLRKVQRLPATTRDTLYIKHMIADAYKKLRMSKEAGKLAIEVLEEGKEVLGIEHPDILSVQCLLSEIYFDQGKVKDAEEIRLNVTEIQSRVLGAGHKVILSSMDSVATLLAAQGKLGDAESIHRQTLALRESVLGGEHPDTLDCMQKIARLVDEQGRHKEAESMYRHIFAHHQAIYGDDNLYTLLSRSELARSNMILNPSHESIALMEEARNSASTVLGERHPYTLLVQRTCSELHEYFENVGVDSSSTVEAVAVKNV